MGVSVIGESGLEMTELNDLREDKGKKKTHTHTTLLLIAMRRCILLTSMGFINTYFLKSYSSSEKSTCDNPQFYYYDYVYPEYSG